MHKNFCRRMVYALLAFAILFGTYGAYPWVPVAHADGAAKIVVDPATAKRRASDERPVIACVEDEKNQPVGGVVITATLTVFAGRPQELTTGTDGCVYLGIDLPTAAGRYDLGPLVLKENPAVAAELVVEITTTLLTEKGVEITSPADARAVFPTGMGGLGEGEVVGYTRQAGFTGPIQADYVKCPSLPSEAGVKHCEGTPVAGLLSAHYQADNLGLEPFALNGPNAPLPAGKKVFLAFRFPKGVPAVASAVTPATIEIVPGRVLPNGLYGHPEEWVRKALAKVLQGKNVRVIADYRKTSDHPEVTPGGLVSLTLVKTGDHTIAVDLAKKDEPIPAGVVEVQLGFKAQGPTPVAPVVTPKKIVAKPAVPGATAVKFPSGTYNHSQKDVVAALAKAGLKVGNVANQKLSQMAGEENGNYWQQTAKGGLLSASYLNAQGQRVFFDLFNPDAPQNQVAPGTVIDLAFRSP